MICIVDTDVVDMVRKASCEGMARGAVIMKARVNVVAKVAARNLAKVTEKVMAGVKVMEKDMVRVRVMAKDMVRGMGIVMEMVKAGGMVAVMVDMDSLIVMVTTTEGENV
jgi:hypothetical protein